MPGNNLYSYIIFHFQLFEVMGKLSEGDRKAVLDVALRENVTSAIKQAQKTFTVKRIQAAFCTLLKKKTWAAVLEMYDEEFAEDKLEEFLGKQIS